MPKSFDDEPPLDNNVKPDAPAKFSMAAAVPAPAVPVAAPAQAVDTSAYNGATLDPTVANEHWAKAYWRPAMGWLYLAVCAFDFILFPILFTVVQFWEVEAANDAFRQWSPLTLQGGGLFHLAMGAVLGISAWGRTKEKSEGKN